MEAKLDLKDKILTLTEDEDLKHIETLDNLIDAWFVYENLDYNFKKVEDSYVLYKYGQYIDENESIFSDIDEQIPLIVF